MPGGPSASVRHVIDGPPEMRNGATASSIPAVTLWVEFGLMTTMVSAMTLPSATSLAQRGADGASMGQRLLRLCHLVQRVGDLRVPPIPGGGEDSDRRYTVGDLL